MLHPPRSRAIALGRLDLITVRGHFMTTFISGTVSPVAEPHLCNSTPIALARLRKAGGDTCGCAHGVRLVALQSME
jgi:hypothetical protein